MRIRTLIPAPCLSFYHLAFALASAIFYGFPSRHIRVIGVTGTKGKTTVTEMLAQILEESGAKVALANGLRFKIVNNEEPNLLKMTMPGRGKLQRFLRDAVNAGCNYAVIEVTSEGIKQHRHRFIKFSIAAITNLQKEHIEVHGSFEAYRAAKGKLFQAVQSIHIINAEDPHVGYYRQFPSERKVLYSRQDADRFGLLLGIPGDFNLMNAVCAATIAESLGITHEIIRAALAEFKGVPGRMQFIQKEPFRVVVDYAHTPDSLDAVYKTLRGQITNDKSLICVLGSAGGGRDKWKRPAMGEIAAKYCDEIILTNEDPYDEDPDQILSQIKSGISNDKFLISNVREILDRKMAIEKALLDAKPGDAVIITGKGSERFLAVGKKKIPWSDAEIVREILNSKS